MIPIERIKKYLDTNNKRIKAVSFDVFDTLLIRLISSEQVSQISANNLWNLLNKQGIDKLTEKDILTSRDDFIYWQRRAAPYKENEWLVSEWLKCLAQENALDTNMLIDLGRQAELNAEESSLWLAKNAYEAIELVKGQDLLILAISDMWLDQEWLKELLGRFGLLFDKVFTSGTLGHSKRRRTIFKVIERDLQLPGNALLHTGNKFRADYLNPRLSGWNSLWMPIRYPLKRIVPSSRFIIRPLSPKPFEEIIQALDIPSMRKGEDPYFRLAYDYIAPLLIIFSIVQWRIFRRQSIDIAYYLARDAYIMNKVYDIISDLLPGSCHRSYIYLSRRAVALAHPDNFLLNAKPLPGKVGRKKVGDWLSNFAIDPELYYSILRESGLDEQSDFNITAKRSIRNACFSHLNEIQNLQEKLREMIRDYLIQEGGKKGIKRIGIVDSGWACTTQDAIRTAFNDSYIISGVYLGVSYQGEKPSPYSNKYGLLRDDFRGTSYQNPIESSAGVVRVWDTLLREPGDTVSALQRLPNGKVIPVLSDTVVIGDRERSAAESIIKGVQQGTTVRLKGVSFITKMNKFFSDADFEMAATAIAQRITTCPTRKTATAIIRLGFDEGTAGRKRGSLGWRGIKDGVAWYPGILCRMNLGFLCPILKIFALILLNFKMQRGDRDRKNLLYKF